MFESVWLQTKEDRDAADWGMLLRLAARKDVVVGVCPSVHYIKTTHSGRVSSSPIPILEQAADMCDRVLPLFAEHTHLALFKRQSAYLRITLARCHGAIGEFAKARSHLIKALRRDIRLKDAWTQLAQAVLVPGKWSNKCKD